VTACKLAEDAKAIDFIGTPRSQRYNNIMTKKSYRPGGGETMYATADGSSTRGGSTSVAGGG